MRETNQCDGGETNTCKYPTRRHSPYFGQSRRLPDPPRRNLPNRDHIQIRQIVGSTLPRKLTFEGQNFRIAKLNRAVQLINSQYVAFRQMKMGKATKKYLAPTGDLAGISQFDITNLSSKAYLSPFYIPSIFFSNQMSGFGSAGPRALTIKYNNSPVFP